MYRCSGVTATVQSLSQLWPAATHCALPSHLISLFLLRHGQLGLFSVGVSMLPKCVCDVEIVNVSRTGVGVVELIRLWTTKLYMTIKYHGDKDPYRCSAHSIYPLMCSGMCCVKVSGWCGHIGGVAPGPVTH